MPTSPILRSQIEPTWYFKRIVFQNSLQFSQYSRKTITPSHVYVFSLKILNFLVLIIKVLVLSIETSSMFKPLSTSSINKADGKKIV